MPLGNKQRNDNAAEERSAGALGHRSLVEAVTKAVAREIQTGRIKPGERIMPGELAKRLDVSQTPVREAMRTLEVQGLVIFDRRNTFASPLSLESINAIYDLRRLIECDAARVSLKHQTPRDVERAKRAFEVLKKNAAEPYSEAFWESHREFHWSIYRAGSNSEWPRRVLEMLWREVERYVTISIDTVGEFASKRQFDAAMDEHAAILKLFIKKDARGLVAMVRRHLERTAGNLEESVEEIEQVR
ncbi:MAG TPA: GntR family transcriptional regulator [Bauldia sp.]|nr:GntR family transcriptional regulator [Bauldia sp.]